MRGLRERRLVSDFYPYGPSFNRSVALATAAPNRPAIVYSQSKALATAFPFDM